jgi:hypothetical protein
MNFLASGVTVENLPRIFSLRKQYIDRRIVTLIEFSICVE